MVLRCPLLDVDLSGVDSCLLLILVGLLLIWEKIHSWLGRRRPYHVCGDGLDSQSALGDLCIDDGVRRGHHITPS
jgi:hypothetical protein